jgi:hypothetical protein
MDLRQTRPGRERFGLGEPHDLEAVLAFCLGYGNLVTTAWWDDIWLKEAFATWLETKIVDTAYPEWRERVRRRRSSAWPYPQTGSDLRAYFKGAPVIRMFENHIGPDVFRRGVQNFLEKHAWRAATSSEFLAAISAARRRTSPDRGPACERFKFCPRRTLRLRTRPQGPARSRSAGNVKAASSCFRASTTARSLICTRPFGAPPSRPQ